MVQIKAVVKRGNACAVDTCCLFVEVIIWSPVIGQKIYFAEVLAKKIEKGRFHCAFPEYDIISIVSENSERFRC